MEKERQDVDIINDTYVTIAVRKDFHQDIQEELHSFVNLTGVHYFSHQLISNYYKKDFYISAFDLDQKWGDLYWREHWFNDPVERKVIKNAQNKASAVVFIEFVQDQENDCLNTRRLMCNAIQGGYFAYIHNDDIMEVFAFGWDIFDKNRFTRENTEKFLDLLDPIRKHHKRVFKDHLTASCDKNPQEQR